MKRNVNVLRRLHLIYDYYSCLSPIEVHTLHNIVIQSLFEGTNSKLADYKHKQYLHVLVLFRLIIVNDFNFKKMIL